MAEFDGTPQSTESNAQLQAVVGAVQIAQAPTPPEVTVQLPAAGQRVVVQVTPGQHLLIPGLDFSAAQVTQEAGGLLITLPDGGQIFLEGNLFNAGIRPAINVGISVSRVGGNAQIKSMKKVAGTLKLDQALYREMEAFSKFGGDLDATTKLVLDKGARNVEILKQAQYAPVPVEKQVAIIYLGTQGLLREVKVQHVKAFEEHFLLEMENKFPDVLAEFKKGVLSDESIRKTSQLASELIPQYK